MKEFFAATWLAFTSMLGINDDQPDKPKDTQEIHQEKEPSDETSQASQSEEGKSQDKQKASEENTAEADKDDKSLSQNEEYKKEVVGDGQFDYEVPEDAPWWSPVSGNKAISEHVQKGEEGQVSTVWGNGTKGQTERSMNHPRSLQVDSKGNIYFVDGSQKDAKLRMFDGKKNKTIVDLVNNKISRRDGYFLSAGLAIIHDNVYISSTSDVYKVVDNRITQLTPKIKEYMKEKRLSDIYRLEKHGEFLYMMFTTKSDQYHIARYNVNGGDVEEIITTEPIPSPYNFYVHGDNEIFITTTVGYVVWEKLFPRQTEIAWEDGDSKTEITDVWIGKDDAMYFVQWEDQANCVIYKNPVGVDTDGVEALVGSRRGFVDGFNDEVEMDYPIDFVWDGSGYLFADTGNNAIRKYWTKTAPMNQ